MSMQKEMLTARQVTAMLIIFIIESSMIVGTASQLKQDSWMSIPVGVVIALPFVMLYLRVIRLYPEMDLFEILDEVLGKTVGKIFTALITLYSIHLGAVVIRGFAEFVEITSLPETPQLPLMFGMIIVSIYIVRSGVKCLGRWSLIIALIITFVVCLTTILLIKNMRIENLMPIMENPPKKILMASLMVAAFPFAESMLFTTFAGSIKKSDNVYKIYFSAILAGSLLLLIVVFRNICVLGGEMLVAEFFTSYNVAKIINVADFFTRIENSITMNFLFAGITKISICVFAASKGIASLFSIKNYKTMVFPIGLSMTALSVILYKDIMESFRFVSIVYVYELPFHILISFSLWIFAEIRKHRLKKLLG
ncbi:MAG: endospore germination permease [Oscillospiraceae bacterium]